METGGDRTTRILADVGEHHTRALGDQSRRDYSADCAGRSRNQGHTARKSLHRQCSETLAQWELSA
jgi:hypothetical protein